MEWVVEKLKEGDACILFLFDVGYEVCALKSALNVSYASCSLL